MYEGKVENRWLRPHIVAAISKLDMIDAETDENGIPLALSLLQMDPAWEGMVWCRSYSGATRTT